MDTAFWKNKRILVTGHTGFKGSWLCLWLQGLGAQVIGYSLPPPTVPSLFETAGVAQGMTSIIGNVQDIDDLRSAIKDHEPEMVVHMAAQSLVRFSYLEPVETYATNVMGTVNLLEAVREAAGVRVFINVTSDKCYENRERATGYREEESLGGYDPYSSSKACSEIVTAAFRQSFFNPARYKEHGVAVASVRAGNVIGGGDWATDRLIPDMLMAAAENRIVKIRNPTAVRPWQHVLEPLRGYLMLAQRMWEQGPEYGEAWNFGPDESDAQPVAWIVERLAELWHGGVRWEAVPSPQLHEANCLKLDCSKSRERLGYFPKLSLEKALQWIVEWQQGYIKHEDIRQLTERQISRYQVL